jgi:hypothetical protein
MHNIDFTDNNGYTNQMKECIYLIHYNITFFVYKSDDLMKKHINI